MMPSSGKLRVALPVEGGLLLPARTIPWPGSISAEARRTLIARASGHQFPPYPPLSDKAGWRAFIRARNEEIMLHLNGIAEPEGVQVSYKDFGGVKVHKVIPPGVPADSPKVLLDFHGGALILLGGEAGRFLAIGAAMTSGLRTISVDYRMPPEFPFPAAVDDGIAAYRTLLERHKPTDIMIGGTSAGGNIAAATLLRARDENLPMPACALLMTPELDLAETGDSFETLRDLDSIHPAEGLAAPSSLYADGRDLRDPYLSPLYGDFEKGFVPTFLQSGTRDMFLSNAVRMHCALKKASVPAELHVYEAMPHGGFDGAPEDLQKVADVRRFVARYLSSQCG